MSRLMLAPLLALNTKHGITEGKDHLRIRQENKTEKGTIYITEKKQRTKIWTLLLCYFNPPDGLSPPNCTKIQGNEKSTDAGVSLSTPFLVWKDKGLTWESMKEGSRKKTKLKQHREYKWKMVVYGHFQ